MEVGDRVRLSKEGLEKYEEQSKGGEGVVSEMIAETGWPKVNWDKISDKEPHFAYALNWLELVNKEKVMAPEPKKKEKIMKKDPIKKAKEEMKKELTSEEKLAIRYRDLEIKYEEIEKEVEADIEIRKSLTNRISLLEKQAIDLRQEIVDARKEAMEEITEIGEAKITDCQRTIADLLGTTKYEIKTF